MLVFTGTIMSKTTLFRYADIKKEPINTPIDSSETCLLRRFMRILDLIPVFNIMIPFWTKSNIQLDTVFLSLKNFKTLLEKIQVVEKQGKNYISSSLININEELAVVPLQLLKEMLVLFRKYNELTKVELQETDLVLLIEYMAEFVRKSNYPDKIGRLNAVFFHENLEVAVLADKRVNGEFAGKFCRVEMLKTENLERYDSRWLTDVRPSCIQSEFQTAVKNYWEGVMTQRPKIEYLFSGKYLLIDAM